MRLIDADALKAEWKMGNFCGECKRDVRQCANYYCFTRMDVCGIIDDAPTVNGWISVKEKLPEDSTDCLVYNGSQVQFCSYYCGTWNTPDCYESETIDGVTHWMPLPAPPEGE